MPRNWRSIIFKRITSINPLRHHEAPHANKLRGIGGVKYFIIKKNNEQRPA